MTRARTDKTASKAAKTTTKTTAQRAISRTPAVKSLPASESTPAPDAANFKRNDLLKAVAARSALPKSDLRAVIELVLDEMGTALSSGRDLALPPLGRVKVQRRKDGEGAEVLSLRLRRKSDAAEPAEIVAEAADG